MIINKQKEQILAVSIGLCIALVALDIFGVKVVNRNELAINIQFYSYGSTFIVATTVFIWLFWVLSGRTKLMFQIIRGLLMGALWWVLSSSVLVSIHCLMFGLPE